MSTKVNSGLRTQQLVQDARSIWNAGVSAVKPHRLFADKIILEGQRLSIDQQIEIDLSRHRRIIVVGAGKASAGMAAALYQRHLVHLKQPVVGWINAPAGTFHAGEAGPNIHLHAGRPAATNEPTQAGIEGTRHILELVRSADPSDLVLVLLSGGGSALLVAPPEGISLEDKQAVAQLISAAGGNIEQLNCVRRSLSEVKGGGLARASRAKRMVSLIISDVLGDSLQTIASGPTISQAGTSSTAAIDALRELNLLDHPRLQSVVQYLQQRSSSNSPPICECGCQPEHVLLANNATAVDAAGVQAVALGYRYLMQSARAAEGDVLAVAQHLAGAAEQLLGQSQVDCLISGGEPTVYLPESSIRGKGGRNQQLTLAVFVELLRRGWPHDRTKFRRHFAFLSGGTDGEDGPTDAAGAWFDASLLEKLEITSSRAAIFATLEDYLQRADAYRFFQRQDSLLQTGSTNTNVCDLRIAIAAV